MDTPKIKPVSALTFLFLISVFHLADAQVTISGTGIVLDNGGKTLHQLREEARQEAIKDALYQAFGSIVYSEYERLVSTEMSGRSVASHSDYRIQYARDYPNGVWLQDIDTTYISYEEGGRLWMRCTINGLAREMDEPKIQFMVKTLDGINYKMNETQDFVDGEKGYIYFKAAADGYLMIFLDDFHVVQRCLPYNAMSENCYPVKAHTDYIFFAPELIDKEKDKPIVDEMEFFTSTGFEYNQFYIFFSPVPFSPAILNQETELADGYSTFKMLKRDYFHSWLQEQRLKNKELQIKTIGITIKKAE